MAKVFKKPNRYNNIVLYSFQIAVVDCDEENCNDDRQDEEEDTNDNKNNDADNYKYDKIDENELADIIQEPNQFQVPHDTDEEEKIVFDESEDNYEEDLFEDSEGDYDPEYGKDISLEVG